MSARGSHKDVLRLLFPIELGGDHDADLELEGKYLDQAQAAADELQREMYPELAYRLLPCWERVCDITPAEDEPLQSRRDKVVKKIRERGGLSLPYFKRLAETLGYTIEIEKPIEFMAGWGCADDTLYIEDIVFQWGGKISGVAVYEFRAGESTAGEPLLWWEEQTYLESLFEELKPAHTYVYFTYEN
jgi:uncharacterized protein YmfQ (DUF2313 family)